MTTFERFTTALRASLNDLMERTARGEDVRATLRQFDEVARSTRGQLSEARAHLRELEDDGRRAHAEALEAETQAIAALRAGDEAEARVRLYQKLESEKEARGLAAQVEDERTQLVDLEETLAALEDKLGPARVWAARQAVGGATAKGARLEDVGRKAERAGERVDAEAEVEAWRELSRDLGHSDANPPTDELRDLKKKLDGDERPKK